MLRCTYLYLVLYVHERFLDKIQRISQKNEKCLREVYKYWHNVHIRVEILNKRILRKGKNMPILSAWVDDETYQKYQDTALAQNTTVSMVTQQVLASKLETGTEFEKNIEPHRIGEKPCQIEKYGNIIDKFSMDTQLKIQELIKRV